MVKSIRWCFAIALTLGFTAPALCEERATKEEAKAMVDAADDLIMKVGAEQSFKDFKTGKAKWPHPQTRKTEGKRSFARQLPDGTGGTGFIGVGVYR